MKKRVQSEDRTGERERERERDGRLTRPVVVEFDQGDHG